MTYAAKIIAHSTAFGVDLVTMELTFPRFLLAEFNTHRVFSRNSASSRAIPVGRRVEQVIEDPFIPESFGKNKAGMQADAQLSENSTYLARLQWQRASKDAIIHAESLARLDVHKQHANRLLEPFVWHTVVVTSTEWENFFNLRCHSAPQPEMQKIAKMARDALKSSTPIRLDPGEWHLPYVEQSDNVMNTDEPLLVNDAPVGRAAWKATEVTERVKISVARCAAISFERQNVVKTVEQYAARHDDLLKSAHMSPFEHQAQAVADWTKPPFSELWSASSSGAWRSIGWFCGNFRAPWLQYRKTIPGEDVFRDQEQR